MTSLADVLDLACDENLSAARRVWRIGGDERTQVEWCEWWLQVCTAVASWPGPPVVVERRITMMRRTPQVREHLIASIANLQPADVQCLYEDLAVLLRPAQDVVLVEEDRGALAERVSESTTACELRVPALGAARSLVAPDAIAKALVSLPSDRGASSLGLLVGSPPSLRADPFDDELPGDQDVVRFRMRLTTDGLPRPVTLALLGSAMGVAGDAWITPRTPAGRRVAVEAHACSSVIPWTPGGSLLAPDDEPLIRAEMAAEVASIPIAL
jgi:hypothetical protein